MLAPKGFPTDLRAEHKMKVRYSLISVRRTILASVQSGDSPLLRLAGRRLLNFLDCAELPSICDDVLGLNYLERPANN